MSGVGLPTSISLSLSLQIMIASIQYVSSVGTTSICPAEGDWTNVNDEMSIRLDSLSAPSFWLKLSLCGATGAVISGGRLDDAWTGNPGFSVHSMAIEVHHDHVVLTTPHKQPHEKGAVIITIPRAL